MWNSLVRKSYIVSEFIMKIALLQILWIIFSIGGLLLFGVIPATISLLAVIRKWQINKDADISMFKIFWNTFRKEFFKANLLGVVVFTIGYLLYLNFSIVRLLTDGLMKTVLLIVIFIVSILFYIVLINLFPIYVHYDLKLLKNFSLSLILGVAFPINTLISGLGLYCFYRLFLWIPGLIPFFCASLPAYFLIWLALNLFNKIEANNKFSNVAVFD